MYINLTIMAFVVDLLRNFCTIQPYSGGQGKHLESFPYFAIQEIGFDILKLVLTAK